MNREELSLCWDCYKADHFVHEGHYCPWAARFKPVEGWTAIPTVIVSNEIEERIESYFVYACPLFEEGRGENGPGKKGCRLKNL